MQQSNLIVPLLGQAGKLARSESNGESDNQTMQKLLVLHLGLVRIKSVLVLATPHVKLGCAGVSSGAAMCQEETDEADRSLRDL
jgi:hypothetical protein